MREDRTLGDAIESQWLGQNGIATGTWANSVGLAEHQQGQAAGYTGGAGGGSAAGSLGTLAGFGAGLFALIQTSDALTAFMVLVGVGVVVTIVAEAFTSMSNAITMVSLLQALGTGGWLYVETGNWLTAIVGGAVFGGGLMFLLTMCWRMLVWFAGTTIGKIVFFPFVVLWKLLKFTVGLSLLIAIGYGVAKVAGWI